MTLKEMGEELGVSPSTISKVLNGCQKNFTIPQELRERILNHVDECGYSPNPVFRSMRVNRNRQIACFFYSRSSFKTGNTVEIAVDEAIKYLELLDYEIYYQFCTRARKVGYPQPNWKVAGILIPDTVSTDQLAALEAKKQVYVAINGITGPEGIAVQSDETANMTLALEHLLELGHRRIAYVQACPPVQNNPEHYSTRERPDAYCAFMRKHNLEPLMIPAGFQDTGWIGEVFAAKPTAVISGNETTGMTLYRAAYERGVRIPEAMSLLVFNDTEFLALATPSVSAIRIPAREMGKLAGRLLEKKIATPSYECGKVYRLPGELILRESTAEPLKPSTSKR